MLKNRIFYAVFLAAALAFSMVYTSRMTAVILVTAIAYPFIAAGIAALQLIFLKADFAETRLTLSKNKSFEFCINVRNSSILPCTPLELVCFIPDAESGRFIRKRIYVSLSPLASAKLIVEGRHLYRGCYTAELETLSIVDPLRIVRLTKKRESKMTFVFLPRKLPLDDVMSSAVGEQNYSRPNSITAEKEDFSHVRDYHIGDNIQLVHWKLTAKQDELMIKQYDAVNDKRVLVICDWSDIPAAPPVPQKDKRGKTVTNIATGGNGDSLLRADTIIETALAFVKAALDNGVHSTVQMCQPPDFRAISVTNNSEYDRFFDMMSVLPAVANGRHEDFLALLDSSDANLAAAVVLITSTLTQEIVSRAEEYAQTSEVYLVFINLGNQPVDNSLYDKPFLFLNIRGSGEDALKLAIAMAKAAE
ncbi:MAG: DUF58 domain-containing protein [Oscillospiraceae bacterium]